MGELLEKYTAMMEMKHKSVPEEEQAVQPATALSSAAKTITALEDHETRSVPLTRGTKRTRQASTTSLATRPSV